MHESELVLSAGKQKGFSFLELTLVIIVISFLLYLGIETYIKDIEKSQREALRYQANSFSRSIHNLRASAQIGGRNFVILDEKKIYLNEFGWPANTHNSMSAKSWNQTPQECQQLWNALYQKPPASVLNISEKTPSIHYLISSINGRICRYELLRKQEGTYFFDYHLSTGEVLTSFE